MQQRIGVYGGTFDPIHNGHLNVAVALTEKFNFQRMLLIPAFVPPHKRAQNISSPYHRYAMATLATARMPKIQVSAVELESPDYPWTINTLEKLQAIFPETELFFVMGADSFAEVISWREHERLLTEYHIVVALRPGHELNEVRPDDPAAHLSPALQERVIDLRGAQLPSTDQFSTPHIWITDYVRFDVSASEIRTASKMNQSIAHLVPQAVAEYISKYQLYRRS
jgi:nicotinate-nucleotide adenylyltransferase